MKTKYLDLRNCYGLLPDTQGLPTFPRLDEALVGINSQPGPNRGTIDSLLRKNQSTCHFAGDRSRLLQMPIDVCQAVLPPRTIHTQAVNKPFPGPALYHQIIGMYEGITHKVTLPLQFLLKGWGNALEGHQCYVHTIGEDIPPSGTKEDLIRLNLRNDRNYYYVGITGRNWLQRLREHFKEMKNDNHRTFYRSWREHLNSENVLFTSTLIRVNQTFHEAMEWEEKQVDKIASDQYRLNMIPGGFKGLRFLHQHRIIDRMDITLDQREKAIGEYHRLHPKKGLPNPFISELWRTDEHYLKVIGAREKTLSPEQVEKIRALHSQGNSLEQIRETVQALDNNQVRRVIEGKTYSRMRRLNEEG